MRLEGTAPILLETAGLARRPSWAGSSLASRLAAAVLVFGVCACAGRAPLAAVPELRETRPLANPSPAVAQFPHPAESVVATPPAPVHQEVIGSLPAVSLGDIGGPEELRLLAASAQGTWVMLCSKSSAQPRLVIRSGSGEPIDDSLAEDPSGRYVIVAQAGAAHLIDTVTGSRVDLSALGADVRRARADYAGHRSLSFDARGRALAYLRRQGEARAIVVRDLESGSERSFPAGPGDVYRLSLSGDQRYVVFDALREDSNRNGKLDWPTPEETEPHACQRPPLPRFRSFSYQGRGDSLTRAVVNLADGSQRDLPELVTPLGSSLLVRTMDGSLELDRGGKRSPLSPAACAGRVLFADAERELALITCVPPPPPLRKGKNAPPPSGKRNVWLVGAGFAKDLKSELYETSTDREAVVGTRLVPLYPGSDAALVDLERRELLPLPAGSRVVATRGPRALIWRDSDLYRFDAENKSEQRLAHGVSKNPDLLQAGTTVLLSPFVVVDIEGPAWTIPGRVLALAAGGFVLSASPDAETIPTSPEGAIRGPLHWLDVRRDLPISRE